MAFLIEIFPGLMFLMLFALLLIGYPAAFSIGATALIFGLLGSQIGAFDPVFFDILPSRIFGVMSNVTLIAVPLFIFMGMVLEKSKIAEDLLDTMAIMWGRFRGGLAISIILVGALLAASTGIVGATVVTMTLISLPVMLKHGYCPKLSSGVIAASGTLGQIIPPSIVLILLSDVLSRPEVSIGKLFAGAFIPGVLLVILYILYILYKAWRDPKTVPCLTSEELNKYPPKVLRQRFFRAFLPPILLICFVLGSIFFGLATPTESAAVGAFGALFLAIFKKAKIGEVISYASLETMKITSMVMIILIGAQAFGLVFRGMGGDELIANILTNLPFGAYGTLFIIMLFIFVAGFFLDFIEITYIHVPILVPILIEHFHFDALWIAILLALNLQTSFLTPPFGFSLFYLKGSAPKGFKTLDIYRGVMPFLLIQILLILLLVIWPQLATMLPEYLYN